MRSRALLALVVLALSCGERGPPQRQEDERATLTEGIVARVGGEPIPASLVAAVAAEQRVSPEDALHKLVDDAIAAQAARMRRHDRVPPARWLLTAVRARLVTDRLREQAVAKGPPTNQEVDELTLRHWQQVDCAVSVRVVHALVFHPKDASLDGSAREQAKMLRAAVADATTQQDFEAKAKAFVVPAPLSTQVEELPPFIEEGGWVAAGGGGTMDQTFATAAHAIAKVGDTSGVVETKFGFHVIRLLERIPEKRIPYEARRIAFTEEARTDRARKDLDVLLAELRVKHPVVIATASEALMRSAMKEREGDAGEP